MGHTHEDIDQMFSRFSVRLKYTDAVTIEELATVLSMSTTPTPKPIILNTVANLSDHLHPKMRKFPVGIMKYRQFKFEMQHGKPIFRCRKVAFGTSEIFRGIGDNSMFTHVFDQQSETVTAGNGLDPHEVIPQGVVFEEVPMAQLKECPSQEHINNWKKTINNAYKQWGLTEDQLASLVTHLIRVVSLEPIPFHWLEEGLTLVQDDAYGEESDVEDLAAVTPLNTGRTSASSCSTSSTQAESTSLSHSIWRPDDLRRMELDDPLSPYRLGDLVVINSGAAASGAASDPQQVPFWLGKLHSIDNPPPFATVNGAQAEDILVQVHWYYNDEKDLVSMTADDTKSSSSGTARPLWQVIKWFPGVQSNPGPQRRSRNRRARNTRVLQWLPKKTFYCVLQDGLTRTGRIRSSDRKLIGFYLTNPELTITEEEGGGDGEWSENSD